MREILIGLAVNLVALIILSFAKWGYKQLKAGAAGKKNILFCLRCIFLFELAAGILLLSFHSFFMGSIWAMLLCYIAIFFSFFTVAYLFFFLTSLYNFKQ